MDGPPPIPDDTPNWGRHMIERMDWFNERISSVQREVSQLRHELDAQSQSFDRFMASVQNETMTTRRLAQEAADDVKSLRDEVLRSSTQNAQQNSTLEALILEIKSLRTHVQVPDGYKRNGLTGMRLLLVEDDPLLADTLMRQLTQRGADVTPVASAEHAREVATARTFDCALVDVGLPGEDGVSLGHWLKSGGVHVVLTTGFPRWRLFDGQSAFTVIEKPARDLDEIVDALRKRVAA
jgi:CheY-like chemotaxis protein